MNKSIIVFDRQDITRLGLEVLIKRKYPDLNIIIAGSKGELLSGLASYPDSVVVIDYTLSDLNSADGLLNISARFRYSQWVLFSDELSIQFLKRVVLDNELFGVVLKTSGVPEIEMCISQALAARQYICLQLKNLLSSASVTDGDGKDVLTITEKEILKEIALGKTAKEIASERNISIHTTITHRKNIYRKLDVNNSHEASRYALRAGIVDASDYFI